MARKSRKRSRNSSKAMAQAKPVVSKEEPPATSSLQNQVLNEEIGDQQALGPGDSKKADDDHEVLKRLVDEIEQLSGLVRGLDSSERVSDKLVKHDDEENAQLRLEIEELRQQNADLASKIAGGQVQDTVRSGTGDSSDALSWEERKLLILEQLEADTFDAETFILETAASRLSEGDLSEEQCETINPIECFEQMQERIELLDEELVRRNKEIEDLSHLLEQRPQSEEQGTAVGAAAIAQMIDSDELVREERERLQQLQAEWEEKFRQTEIEASLERAKLSRERQQLAKKLDEVEEELAQLRRDERTEAECEGHSRKWLAKLGLASDNE